MTHHPATCSPCPDCREALQDYARLKALLDERAYLRTLTLVRRDGTRVNIGPRRDLRALLGARPGNGQGPAA